MKMPWLIYFLIDHSHLFQIAFEGNLPNLQTSQGYDIAKTNGYENFLRKRRHRFHHDKVTCPNLN